MTVLSSTTVRMERRVLIVCIHTAVPVWLVILEHTVKQVTLCGYTETHCETGNIVWFTETHCENR